MAMDGRIATGCRHQGRCLVEEGGNVTGWACVAYLLTTLPTRRSLSSHANIDLARTLDPSFLRFNILVIQYPYATALGRPLTLNIILFFN